MAMFSCYKTFHLGGSLLGLTLTADEHGLRTCNLSGESKADGPAPVTNKLEEVLRLLERYFNGDKRALAGTYAPHGTPFQRSVWQATSQIPPGKVESYGDLAKQIGNPGGMRAVAQALGANPLPLFIPCHRVIRSNGTLGGFSCGIEWKKLLLAHEGYCSCSEWD